jgi:hypothetical protein
MPSGLHTRTPCAHPPPLRKIFSLSFFEGPTSTGVPFFARFNPNPKFGPEQLNGYEAGYRRLLGKNIYVDFASFLNHYHGLLSQEITDFFRSDARAGA